MAETSTPWQTGAGTAVTEALWKAMAGQWMASGVIGSTRNTGDPSLTPSIPGGGGGPTFGLTAGDAYVDGLLYSNSAPLTKTASANPTGNPRIDRLVLKRDTTAKTVTAVIVEGTVSSSPTPPTLTPTATVSYLAIARATVAGGASVYSNLVDERVFTGRRSVVGPATAFAGTPATGDDWYQGATGLWQMWTGSGYSNVAEVLLGLGAKLETAEALAAGTTESSSFDDVRSGAPVVGTSFVAPLSGKVVVHTACGISTPSGSVIGSCSVRIGTGATLGGGTEIEPAILDRALQNTGSEVQAGRTDTFEDLDPGTTYNATMMFRTNTGTSTFSRCYISVDPKLA